MQKKNFKINETEHIVDDHFFDVVGNEFKDHVKGLAEWLKNSADAYIDKDVPLDEQYVVIRFDDRDSRKTTIECIDFVGMSRTNIDKAFKRWGDPTAAKRGKNIKVYGGHGNGGKFYMRQAFSESRFITYKDGLLNIFGFSQNKKYGYAKGYEDKKMIPSQAMKFAGIDKLPIPEKTSKNILSMKTGFTVVVGYNPVGIRRKFKPSREMEKLKNFPQSRRILQQINVSVIHNDNSLYGLLKPDELKPLEKFEIPRMVEIPKVIEQGERSDRKTIKLSDERYPQGRLVLRTSSEPLARNGKLGELNRIDVLGEVGVIGSYQLYELGVKCWPQAAYIYGECQLPILEDPDHDCVSNDRTKLVKNEITDALVNWISEEIDKLASEINASEREKQKVSQKEISSKLNDVLNQWKNKYMKRIMSELFSGSGDSSLDDGNGGSLGTTVTSPPTGFDFKYPEVEIPLNANSRATLKVCVPETLPLGATIFVSIDSDAVSLESDKYVIKSDYLKSTPEGKEIAFINIGMIGVRLSAEAVLTATAGKLSSSVKVRVIESKEGKSGRAFPKVLLSSFDIDPLGLVADGSLILSDRDPVVYQRPQDVTESIYWINTSSPMASKICELFTQESIQWRNFLFERYVDIFIKEAIHELEKKDYENFTADTVDQKISDTVKKIHQTAKDDLGQFLFDQNYVI